MTRLLLVGVLVGACNGAAHHRAPLDALAGPRTEVVTGVPPAPEPSAPADLPRETKLVVTDAGAAPRTVLRYAIVPAPERKLVATLQITSRTLDGGAWSPRTTRPPFEQGLALEIGRGGVLHLRPLPTTDTSPMSASWRAIVQRRATVTADPAGRLTGLAFADGTTGATLDELWQVLLGLAVRLPDEPIGPGATWRTSSLLRMGDATVEQLADATLVAVDGDRWTVALDVRRIGEDQDTGGGVELIGLFREMKGTVTLTPADPLPVDGELSIETRVHARAGGVDHASEDVGTVTMGSGSTTSH